MQTRKGKPIIERGTPPTPANSNPSNQIIKRYANGSYDIRTPPPTPKVIAEYEQAIADAPDDADLRMHFAFSLSLGGEKQAAAQQAQEAARLRPEWTWPHSFLATSLLEAGSVDEAVAQCREALRLGLQEDSKTKQREACYRWGLAEALLRKGATTEAHQELENALSLQREAVSKQQGSLQLLRQLEAKWSELSGAS